MGTGRFTKAENSELQLPVKFLLWVKPVYLLSNKCLKLSLCFCSVTHSCGHAVLRESPLRWVFAASLTSIPSCVKSFFRFLSALRAPGGSFDPKGTKIPVWKVSHCCCRWWSQLVCKEKGKTAESSCFWVSTEEMSGPWKCPAGIKEIISAVCFLLGLFSYQSVWAFQIPASCESIFEHYPGSFPGTFPLCFPSFEMG